MLVNVLIYLLVSGIVACIGIWSLVFILYKRTGPVYQSDNKFEAPVIPLVTQNLQKPVRTSKMKYVPIFRTEKEELALENKKNDEFR